MAGWHETYRGAVSPGDCDVTEHLTVASYYDRFADATLALLERLGVGLSYMQGERMGCATIACDTRYMRELRAGDALHIESALLAADGKRLRIGHHVYDSATGEPCTEMVQSLLHMHMDERRTLPIPPDRLAMLTPECVPWDGGTFEERTVPDASDGFTATGRDTVRPWEIDVVGHMGFQFYVHRFSAAGMQLFAALGLTPGWMRDHRRGYSTFEFRLRFRRELNAGDLLHMRTGLMHLGGSSIRMLHRLFNVRTGELSAELDQFGVLLDLDKRRPTRIPDDIRGRAEALRRASGG